MSISETETVLGASVVDLSTVFNFRDLGGLRTTDGRRVRSGVVYRSDGLHRLTHDDSDRLTALGLRTILDLRTSAEVAAAPSVRLFGIDVFRLPVLARTWDDEDLLTATDDPVAFLTERYETMLIEGRQAFVSAFQLLGVDHRLPAVFHCTAGKDRTGVLAALLLRVLGVLDEAIVGDYEHSAAAMTRMVAWLEAHRPEVARRIAAQPAALLACPGDAMRAFLRLLDERYGGAETYLVERGVSAPALEELRQALLTG